MQTPDSVQYGLVAKGKAGVKFRRAFLDFWRKIVDAGRNEAVFDDAFADVALSWLVVITR